MNVLLRPVIALEPEDVPLDHLTQLELRIAKRADELARLHEDRDHGKDFWLDAEREVLGRELVNVTVQ